MFELHKNEKLIANFLFWEDAESFVEELKRLNPNFIDRRKFKVVLNNDVFKE